MIAQSNSAAFKKTTDQTDTALDAQAGVELALRFFAFRSVPYKRGLDVHEYLDRALMRMATGVSKNVRVLARMRSEKRKQFIQKAARELWQNQTFGDYSGAGVRGSTRLSMLLPMAAKLLKPQKAKA